MSSVCQLHPDGPPMALTIDRPYDPASGQCRRCWVLAGGKAEARTVSLAPPRSLPCVHEGAVTEFAACGSEWKHVRDCERFDGPCTRGPSRVRSCHTCSDYSTGRPEVHFHLSAHGIGDAIVATYVACGLADAGYSAVFHCRQAHWLAGVSHPGVTVLPHRADTGADGNRDYQGQLRAGARGEGTRAQWYCDRISEQAGVPRFSPARPKTVVKPAPVLAGSYAVVAPFSNWRTRDYPHWPAVVANIPGRVVVIGSTKDGQRLPAAFGSLPPSVSWHWGQPVGWVLSAVANASHVYGNDSGMVHLAGLYGVPATAVTAHLPGRFLFGEAPSVRTVSPSGWGCSPCGWQHTRGYQRKCDAKCAALESVPAGRAPLPVLPQHELNATLDVGQKGLVGVGEGG